MAGTADLERFVEAQVGVHERALAELQAGAKRSHWMWFVFPQLVGLGSSPMARRYALASPDEARAYLAHPVLGPRLLACTAAVVAGGRPAHAVFGAPDDVKFRSSMTLFAGAAEDPAPFRAALDSACGGIADPLTLARLARTDPAGLRPDSGRCA